MVSASAASRWAGSSTTGSSSAPCLPALTTCPPPTIASIRLFRKGEPDWGGHLADELERHGRAARREHDRGGDRGADGGIDRRACRRPRVTCSRLRAICDKYGILAHPGRGDHRVRPIGPRVCGRALRRACPIMMTFAKGVTSGSAPMGGVIVRKGIYDAFMRGPEHVAELFHGYTYSAHPLACAAGLASARPVSRRASCSSRAASARAASGPTPQWGSKDLPNVLDIRCCRSDGRHRPGLATRRGGPACLRSDGARFHQTEFGDQDHG